MITKSWRERKKNDLYWDYIKTIIFILKIECFTVNVCNSVL